MATIVAWLLRRRQRFADGQWYKYLFMLALPLLCGSLYWWQFYFPNTMVGQNRLDDVLGEAELVLGAEYNIYRADISPDGQWIAVDMNRVTPYGLALYHVETAQYYPLTELDSRRFNGWPVWLDNNHFTDASGDFIVRVSDFLGWAIDYNNEEEYWVQANHIYGVLDYDRAALISTDPALPYKTYRPVAELPDILANFPYTIVERGGGIGDERVYSPDGRYYMAKVFIEDPTQTYRRNDVAMFDTNTHQEVAHAYKWDWNSSQMGWAADSSGFYILFAPQGEYLDFSKERHPIYKLLVPDATLEESSLGREGDPSLTNISASLNRNTAVAKMLANPVQLENGHMVPLPVVADRVGFINILWIIGLILTGAAVWLLIGGPHFIPWHKRLHLLWIRYKYLLIIGLPLLAGFVEYTLRPYELNWALWLTLATIVAWLLRRRQHFATGQWYKYLFMLALPLLCGSLYWWQFYFPNTIVGQNRLDDVLGEAELVLGAEYNISRADISPDGQWIAVGDNSVTPYGLALYHVETAQYYPLTELDSRRFNGWPVWLDNDHFTDASGDFIVRVSDFKGWAIDYNDAEEYWLQANHIYGVLDYDRAALISTDPTIPYKTYRQVEEIPSVLTNIPYTIVERDRTILDENRVYSPDGRYYMAMVFFEDPTRDYRRRNDVAMFDATTHQEVAHAHKWDWNSSQMGWAADSSGFYILFAPQGEYLDASKERHPIYKLLVPNATSNATQLERNSVHTTTGKPTRLVRNNLSELIIAKHSLVPLVAQSSDFIWYIDDVELFSNGYLNMPPVAVDDRVATAKDTAIIIPVLDNDNDIDGDGLTVQTVTQPTNGQVIINFDDTLTYTPTIGFEGTDTFSYTIKDTQNNEAIGQVIVSIVQLTFIEAENYTNHIPRTGQSWLTRTTFAGYSGNGYVQTSADIGSLFATDYISNSPELQYQVAFSQTGVYAVWVYGAAANAGGDSVHIGLNGAVNPSSAAVTGFQPNQWNWSRSTMAGGVATITITTPGVYTLNVWVREDGLRVDRLLIVPGEMYVPGGE
ncbi:MAG: cadherin-like domain-containing protein [Ardenticatenaceae bacterium]|nr:cadherin-like domain-containing protein [Ardenticatenaceae bacterium]